MGFIDLFIYWCSCKGNKGSFGTEVEGWRCELPVEVIWKHQNRCASRLNKSIYTWIFIILVRINENLTFLTAHKGQVMIMRPLFHQTVCETCRVLSWHKRETYFNLSFDDLDVSVSFRSRVNTSFLSDYRGVYSAFSVSHGGFPLRIQYVCHTRWGRVTRDW